MPKPVGTEKPRTLSAWQRLIESERLAKGISYRRLGEMAQIPHSTLYQWVCVESGHPKKNAYPASVNARLSRALAIDPYALMKAFDESATQFSGDLTQAHSERLSRALKKVSSSRKQSYSKDEVLALLRDIQE